MDFPYILFNCDNCGAPRKILLTSLSRTGPNCRDCRQSVSPEALKKALSQTSWAVETTPRHQKDALKLKCKLCGTAKSLVYKSFISKPIECPHPQFRRAAVLKQLVSTLGFDILIIPQKLDFQTPVVMFCRACAACLKISISECQIGGCPNCRNKLRP